MHTQHFYFFGSCIVPFGFWFKIRKTGNKSRLWKQVLIIQIQALLTTFFFIWSISKSCSPSHTHLLSSWAGTLISYITCNLKKHTSSNWQSQHKCTYICTIVELFEQDRPWACSLTELIGVKRAPPKWLLHRNGPGQKGWRSRWGIWVAQVKWAEEVAVMSLPWGIHVFMWRVFNGWWRYLCELCPFK